jgi:hypothetical protein
LGPWAMANYCRAVTKSLRGTTVLAGVTKICRLSWLTNSSLVYEPKCEEEGGGGLPMSTAVHMEPK